MQSLISKIMFASEYNYHDHCLCFFRFNEFSRDLDDLMATLEHDFRKQDTYLVKDWYKKVVSILTKRGAVDGINPNALPRFLKGVTTIISLEVHTLCNIFRCTKSDGIGRLL